MVHITRKQTCNVGSWDCDYSNVLTIILIMFLKGRNLHLHWDKHLTNRIIQRSDTLLVLLRRCSHLFCLITDPLRIMSVTKKDLIFMSISLHVGGLEVKFCCGIIKIDNKDNKDCFISVINWILASTWTEVINWNNWKLLSRCAESLGLTFQKWAKRLWNEILNSFNIPLILW